MVALLSMGALLFALGAPPGQFPDPIAGQRAGELVVKAGKVGELPADFGTLSVPENWDQPSKLIHLPVVRIRSAAEKAAEPVFFFHGGPGSSNIKLDVSYERLLRRHDVVLVGYRGVDGSVSLAQPEFSQLLKTVADPLSAEGLRACAAAASRGAEQAKARGIDVAQYDLDATVRDIEAARKALGFETISTSGSSFGGAVGYYYSLTFPERVTRSVLIEVAFPWNLGLAEPSGVDTQIRMFGKAWSNDKDIASIIRNVLASLPRRQKVPTPQGEVEVLVDPGTIKLMTFFSLYTAQQRARTFDAFVAASQGNFVPLAMTDLFWGQVVDWFNWGDMMAKVASSRTGPMRDYEKELAPEGSIIGSPLSLLGYGMLQHTRWPARPMKIQGSPRCSVETVLICGNEEGARGLRERLATFDKARLVVLGGLGHMDVYQDADVLQEAFLTGGLAALPPPKE
jgi:pimeloyl-ACP methyl ester carboxylesterase